MRLKIHHTKRKLAWLSTTALIASFIIFHENSLGRYFFLCLSGFVLLMATLRNKGRIWLQIKPYHMWAIAFIAFTYFSGLWAKYSASVSIGTGTSLFLTFFCSAMVYLYYQDEENIKMLLSSVMWAGYIVAVYTLVYYGFDTLMLMASESAARMENEYANVNSIGMIASLACVLQVNDLFNKKPWSALLMIPSVVVIAATQSRKAFVMLIGGIIVLSLLKSLQNRTKDRAKIIFRFVVTLVLAIIGLRYILELPIFGGVLGRMEGLIENLTGAGDGGTSSALRQKMQELGWELFAEHPIAGVGMNNTQFYAGLRLGIQAYLHNNFVEILAGGGILGFLLYYWGHAYILVSLFKYRHADENAFIIGLVWMGIILIMDYGMVSYTEKTHIFYMMIHFLNVESMKHKHRSLVNDC